MVLDAVVMADNDVYMEYRKKYGGYNDMPPNMEELTVEQFVQSIFFHYNPRYIEHRQVTRDKDGKPLQKMMQFKMFYFHDGTGIAFHHEYWEGKVHYYKFAVCVHNMKELTVEEARQKGIYHAGRMYHVYECTKCGYHSSEDSSD